MSYEIGAFGGIAFDDRYLIHNDRNVVEKDKEFKDTAYIMMISNAENSTGYEIFDQLEKTGEIYEHWNDWYEGVWYDLRNLDINHFSLSLLDDLKSIRFVNEDGYLFIIDGHLNKKIRVGKILDEEIVESLTGSMEQLIIPLMKLYWKLGGKIIAECLNRQS